MFTQEQTQWQQMVNPTTGRPFTSYGDYSAWATPQERGAPAAGNAAGDASRKALSPAAGGEYNWSGTSGYWVNDKAGSTGQGNVYFGADPYWAKENPSNFSAGFVDENGNVLDQSQWQTFKGYGFIDPHTGKITYVNDEKYSPTGPTATSSRNYDAWRDYGLGSENTGIIPIGHDASGTPTAFYVGTQGGGGQVVQSLEDAKTLVDGFRTWYAEKNKLNPNTGGSPGNGGTGTTGTVQTGVLNNPLQGENYFDSTKDFYTGGTHAGETFGKFSGQPTASEQTWNGFSGQFNQPSDAESLWGNYKGTFDNPAYLDDYYNRELKRAEGSLADRASTGGWGDSSAMVRAAGGLGQRFADSKLLGMENFAKTGMGLAQASDSGRIGRATTMGSLADAKDAADIGRVNAASTTDASELAKILGGQNAANATQGQTISRLTGGLSSSVQLGQDLAALTSAGLSQANSQQFLSQLQGLAYQVQSGDLTYEAALAQAKETANTMGAVSGPILNALLIRKLGGKAQ